MATCTFPAVVASSPVAGPYVAYEVAFLGDAYGDGWAYWACQSQVVEDPTKGYVFGMRTNGASVEFTSTIEATSNFNGVSCVGIKVADLNATDSLCVAEFFVDQAGTLPRCVRAVVIFYAGGSWGTPTIVTNTQGPNADKPSLGFSGGIFAQPEGVTPLEVQIWNCSSVWGWGTEADTPSPHPIATYAAPSCLTGLLTFTTTRGSWQLTQADAGSLVAHHTGTEWLLTAVAFSASGVSEGSTQTLSVAPLQRAWDPTTFDAFVVTSRSAGRATSLTHYALTVSGTTLTVASTKLRPDCHCTLTEPGSWAVIATTPTKAIIVQAAPDTLFEVTGTDVGPPVNVSGLHGLLVSPGSGWGYAIGETPSVTVVPITAGTVTLPCCPSGGWAVGDVNVGIAGWVVHSG